MSLPALPAPPEVPISVFKANPIAYADTGAVVMVHSRPRMRVVPIAVEDPPRTEGVKARLRILNALLDSGAADEERAALASERDADLRSEAR